MTVASLSSVLFLVVGCAFFFAGTVGLLRFPDTLTRLHALTKADNVGLGLLCIGLALHDGSLLGALRLLLIWLLVVTASTLSAFYIARWAVADRPGREPSR